MAVQSKNNKKRKGIEDEQPEEYAGTSSFSKANGLEMLSGEEGNDDSGSEHDDSDVEEFPEINADSDSESGEEVELDEDAEGLDDSDEEEEDSEGSSSDDDASATTIDDLCIFPKSKTIISDITGQPKTIYPEIEPDYDSDSSTEDVSYLLGNRVF
jgi:ribosome biogenesis protein ERB1